MPMHNGLPENVMLVFEENVSRYDFEGMGGVLGIIVNYKYF